MALALLALTNASAALAQSAPPASAPPAERPASDKPPKWGASLDFEGKAGTRRHLGEADLLVPLLQDARTLLFANARFRFDDNSSKEGNLGLGVRRTVDGGWNLGAYGYFDRRRSENHHYFNQATFGAEALGRDFDLRANLYLPFGERIKQVDSLNTASLSGASVVFRGGEERAIPGFDAELGWRAPVFDADGPYDLRLYAGGYRFDDPAVEAVAGPRLRAEFTAYEVPQLWEGARLTLGAEWQHDDVRGSQAFFSARLRIPLQVFAGGAAPKPDRPKLTAQERRMTAPVVRDVDVVSQAGAFAAPETATETASGSAITVLSSASTTGAALPGAVAAAGADSTVILSGTFNTTAVTTLQAGQTVIGAGTLTVRSPSGRTATLTTPTATVAGAINAGTAVTMATNSTVSGLTVSNTSAAVAQAILANVAGATIANNTVTITVTAGGPGQVASAIAVGGSNNVTVSGNTLNASSTGGGVSTATGLFASNATNVTVAGNTFNSTGANNNFSVDGNPGTSFVTAASTGNVLVSGACNAGGVTTGSVSFTNGTTCP